MNVSALVFSSLLLSSCSYVDRTLIAIDDALTVENHDPTHGDSSGQPRTPKTESAEHRLVRNIVASKPATPLRTTLGYSRHDALYLGASNGCDYVALTNLEFKQHKNFTVCGSRITEANEPAPTLPQQGETRYTIAQNINSAYLNRASQQVWQGYRIDSVQVGPLRADGCAQIFTKITYNHLLVDTSLKTVCQGGIQK